MEWRERDGVRWLEADLGGARAAFLTRLGGVSDPPCDSLNLGLLTEDSPRSVEENRRRLAGALGLEPAQIVFALQVHGTRLLDHSAPDPHLRGFFVHQQTTKEPRNGVPEADGHLVRDPGLAPLVFVADCLPVALSGPGGLVMAHAGWRGLAGGILEDAAAAVGAEAAAIGPGIGPCCYEVGDDIADAYRARFGATALRGRNLDLWTVAERLLRDAGVEPVERVDVCTACNDDFFSHRRDKGVTGRQGVIGYVA
jgi:polyphenol oxidase